MHSYSPINDIAYMYHIHEIVTDGIFEGKFKVWYMTSESWQWSLLNLKVIGKGKSLTTFCVGVSSDVMVICPCVLDPRVFFCSSSWLLRSPEKRCHIEILLTFPIFASNGWCICQRIKSGQVYDDLSMYHGNPQPSFLVGIIHILGV